MKRVSPESGRPAFQWLDNDGMHMVAPGAALAWGGGAPSGVLQGQGNAGVGDVWCGQEVRRGLAARRWRSALS